MPYKSIYFCDFIDCSTCLKYTWIFLYFFGFNFIEPIRNLIFKIYFHSFETHEKYIFFISSFSKFAIWPKKEIPLHISYRIEVIHFPQKKYKIGIQYAKIKKIFQIGRHIKHIETCFNSLNIFKYLFIPEKEIFSFS